MNPALTGCAPISQVHAQVIQDLGLDALAEISDTDKWYRWIMQFLVDYQIPLAFAEMISDIPIEACTARKPAGYVKTISVHLIDVPGVPAPIAPRLKRISDRRIYGPSSKRSGTGFLGYEVNERDYYFETSSNADGATLHLRYDALYLGENELPMVDMSYYDAIKAYCYMNYAMTMVGQNKQGWENKHAYARQEFVRARRQCANPVGKMSLEQYRQIAAIWSDPRYAKQNPASVEEANINTNHAFRGVTTSAIRYFTSSYLGYLGGHRGL